jgi:hypothetical protein
MTKERTTQELYINTMEKELSLVEYFLRIPELMNEQQHGKAVGTIGHILKEYDKIILHYLDAQTKAEEERNYSLKRIISPNIRRVTLEMSKLRTLEEKLSGIEQVTLDMEKQDAKTK